MCLLIEIMYGVVAIMRKGLTRVIIANRGECACRIMRTCTALNIECVVVYTKDDANSLHVRNAATKILIDSYVNGDDIIRAALESGADSIHPGYGFLSEHPEFARKCISAGLVWIGPSPAAMEAFSSKTTARRIAEEVGVPCSPGSPTLCDVSDAVNWAARIGYPVLLKPAGGGGGIGMTVCESEEELSSCFERVQSIALRYFACADVFLERYVRNGRHIEVQVFGDGEGNVIHLGERECSIQRRYQKLIEECPSSTLTPDVQSKIHNEALRLCKHVKYESAGTVEFIYDDRTRDFYFLEVNTRIQVEHGVTESVSSPAIDLVAWMIKQAHPETRFPITDYRWSPNGHAIEFRIYAEDPMNNFQPSPGIIHEVYLDSTYNPRIETWVYPGCAITPLFDPLVLKIIQWGPTRAEAIKRMKHTVQHSSIAGVTTNMDYLEQVLSTDDYARGNTYITTLDRFRFSPRNVEVLQSGMNVTIQDYPGRTNRGLWRIGVPPSGPMDHLSHRLANSLVGNLERAATMEITIKGPTLKFHTSGIIAIAGASFNVNLNKLPIESYSSVAVKAGDVLSIGTVASECGVRCYLAIRGGFSVPYYLGSRSTFLKGGFGGFNGRELRAGDMIPIGDDAKESFAPASLEKPLQPLITNTWHVGVLPGPMGAPDYMTHEDIEMLHKTYYEVHHNSNRMGIRLIGPAPMWARSDGGEGGSHPSNIHDCEYAIGTVNFTGNMPVIIGHDGPSLGGFVCPVTIVQSELWKIGQMKAGDRVRFEVLNISDAARMRLEQSNTISRLSKSKVVLPSDYNAKLDMLCSVPIVAKVAASDQHPGMIVRLAGDSYVLVEYGEMTLDIRLRVRIHLLEQHLLQESINGLEETAPGVRSLQIRYNGFVLALPSLLDHILSMDEKIASINNCDIPSRVIHLPMAWDHSCVGRALDTYMQSVRSKANYLPSNIKFVAANNGVTEQEVYEKVFSASYMCLGLGDVYLGACCATPIDPRHRLVNPKFNPARTYTAEGTVGLGGAYMCIYPMDSPGGYQLIGRTLPIWNTWGTAPLFSPKKPWLFEMFDQIRFYPVLEDELELLREQFKCGEFTPLVTLETFNVGGYSTFLSEHADEIAAYQKQQQSAAALQAEVEQMIQLETPVLEQDASDVNGISIPSGHCSVDAVISAKVWNILVKEGDYVSDGDAVIVLEAMKMEITVNAKCNGIVTSVCVEKGATVNSGAVLLIIREDPLQSQDPNMNITSLRESFLQNSVSICAFIKSICASNGADSSIRKLAEERAADLDASIEESLPLLGIPFMTTVDSEDDVINLFHNLGAIHVGCVDDSSSVRRALVNKGCSFIVGDKTFFSHSEVDYSQICMAASLLPFELIASKDVRSLEAVVRAVHGNATLAHKEFVVLRPVGESGSECDVSEELRLLAAAEYTGLSPDVSMLQALLKELNAPKISAGGTYTCAVNTMRIVQQMYNALEKFIKDGSVLVFPTNTTDAEIEEVLFYLLGMLNMSVMKLRNGMLVAAAQGGDVNLVSFASVLACS